MTGTPQTRTTGTAGGLGTAVPDMSTVAHIRLDLLEVTVTPLNATETVDLILDHVAAHSTLVLGNLNLHGVYVHHTDPDFADYCDSCDVVLIDGAPLAWVAGTPLAYRIGSTDWLDELMPRAAGLTVLAVGGTPESSAGARDHFRRLYPETRWTGVDGYSSATDTPELRALIADADIVLVGMGMPVQERWIMHHRDQLDGKVVANVGGCLDYYSGTQKLAPRWTGRLGLEWLYRLAADPARLAGRYLVEPLKLASVLVRMKVRRRRRPRPGRTRTAPPAQKDLP